MSTNSGDREEFREVGEVEASLMNLDEVLYHSERVSMNLSNAAAAVAASAHEAAHLSSTIWSSLEGHPLTREPRSPAKVPMLPEAPPLPSACHGGVSESWRSPWPGSSTATPPPTTRVPSSTATLTGVTARSGLTPQLTRGGGAWSGAAPMPSFPASTFAGTEAAVLIDGLDRENELLRRQVERSSAREQSQQAEMAELRAELDVQRRRGPELQEADSASTAAEGARLRSVVQRQGEIAESVAARLEALQEEQDSKESLIAALQNQLAAAKAEAQALCKELQGIVRFVLPRAPVDVPLTQELDQTIPKSSLQAVFAHLRRITSDLRYACEAKFETLGFVQQQVRGQLRYDAYGLGGSDFLTPQQGELPLQAAASEAEEALARSLAPARSDWLAREEALNQELQHAREEGAVAEARSREVAIQLKDVSEERLGSAKEMENLRRALRVREAEVRELQLIGKYFAGRSPPLRPPELAAAEIAEDLRTRCAQLSEETTRLRAERDVLRAEKDRADRLERW